jgi:hypothetical protein
MGRWSMTDVLQMPPGFTLEIQNSDRALVEVKYSQRIVFSRCLPLSNEAVYAAVADATEISWAVYMEDFQADWEGFAKGLLIADDHDA